MTVGTVVVKIVWHAYKEMFKKISMKADTPHSIRYLAATAGKTAKQSMDTFFKLYKGIYTVNT